MVHDYLEMHIEVKSILYLRLIPKTGSDNNHISLRKAKIEFMWSNQSEFYEFWKIREIWMNILVLMYT